MATAVFSAKGSKLELTTSIYPRSGQAHYDRCRFEFDSEWDGLVKTVVFYQRQDEKVYVLLEENEIEIPSTAIKNKGLLYIGVVGIAGDKILPTNTAYLQAVQGCYEGEIPPPTDEVPNIYQSIINAMEAQAYEAQQAKIYTDEVLQVKNEIEQEHAEFFTATDTVTSKKYRWELVIIGGQLNISYTEVH